MDNNKIDSASERRFNRNLSLQQIEAEIRASMQTEGIADKSIREFLRRVAIVYKGASGKRNWEEVGDLAQEDCIDLSNIPPAEERNQYERSQYREKIVVIKLNGGLGTSMGLTRAKSLIPVREGYNFLQIIRKQIELLRKRWGVPVPILFMNSFNTRQDTLAEEGIAELNNLLPGPIAIDFLQNRVPRIYSDTLLPVRGAGEQGWCPPGHGDIFLALESSGILEKLLKSGYRALFISNGDNLGAVVEERILNWFFQNQLEWVSEVTAKTAADLKGGVLFRRKKGQTLGSIELLETAQVPENHVKDFQDRARFPYFNINNLWVNLETLRDLLKKEALNLELIVNPKQFEGRQILQLETAMGAAIGCFQRSAIVNVPRRRFSPVKTCADLLLLRSDACHFNEEDYSLSSSSDPFSKEQEKQPPIIKLDSAYKNLESFEQLVPKIPSLVEASSLEVEGRVLFDQPVKICGKVKIKAGNRSGKKEGNDTISKISSSGRSQFINEEVILA